MPQITPLAAAVLLTAIVVSGFSENLNAGETTFGVDGDQVLLDGRPFKIIGVRCSNALISDWTTRDLIENLPVYRQYGLNAVSVFFMGSRFGDVKGYRPDASLDPLYAARMGRIIEAADELNMVVVVGCLYWSTSRANDELVEVWTQQDANRAIANTVRWLSDKNYRNVFVDVDNEGMAHDTMGWSIAGMIDAGHAVDPTIMLAYNDGDAPPDNADLYIHHSPKVEGKPWLDTEATPRKSTPGGYWGRFSKQTHRQKNSYYNYSRIGRYTAAMKAEQLRRTEDEIERYNGHMLASTWLQCAPAESVEGPFVKPGGSSNIDDIDADIDKLHSDAGIAWWLEFVKEKYGAWNPSAVPDVRPAIKVAATPKEEAEHYFNDRIDPFVRKYCLSCHSNRRPTEAGLSFSPALKDPGHAAFSEPWRKSVARVKAHDMPPDYADDQPSDEDRQAFVDWLGKLKFLSEKDPGRFVIRRLTKAEYGNTLHDLFGVDPSIADSLPDEVSGEGFLNSLSPLQLEQYLTIAGEVLESIGKSSDTPSNELQLQLLAKPPSSDVDARASARRFAALLARRAYRRPPSSKEVDVLLEVFDLGRQNGFDDSASLRLMAKAALVSPQFLFITPVVDSNLESRVVPLDDHQLASRMSYLLWATMPDDELMRLADAGTLHEPATLKAQVKRLLDDPRSRALFDGFGAQWLGLGKLDDKVFDTSLFPEMTDDLRDAMYNEARLFFESVVRENRRVVDFVDCDYTFLNETLALIYGLESHVTGRQMRRVQLTSQNRGGILAMPGVLAATSFPNRTSPVNRGVWVLEQVLGDHVPPAPPDVPELEEQDQKTVVNLTLRERTELHRTDAVCANCHKTLDPIGFGLENFDAIGRWREKDENGEVIDASGELPGGATFSGPRDLKTMIAHRKDKLARNLVEKLLAYALCRRLEGYDEIVIDELMQKIAADGYRMQTLVTAVVTSYPFTHRRVLEEGASQ